MSAGRIQFVGINKDRSWQEPPKILMGCPEQLPGDAGGGAVPTRTWARGPKDTGTKGHGDSPAGRAGLTPPAAKNP